ncbi:vWA domain-containing protein [Floridanema aerugineum]|uniref:VWA domain-containing protein n=1 Tax=Floridaenema aerugineum BLCC-F46 TaxID=3153654 RepID=A0ABV4X1I2_9CYAN
MIDQSTSMSDKYANSTKAEFAALAVNRIIAEIIEACAVGDEIRDRCYVAVIGYGAGVNVLFLEKVSDLAKNPNTTTVKKKQSDGAGGLVEVDEVMRVFANPVASGGTPMAQAFRQAYKGAEKFVSSHPNTFPPIIINITDGEPDSIDDAIVEANKLSQLKTTDGNVIILNAHISTASAGKVELPNSNSALSANKFANFLFDISTVLPDVLASKAKDVGFNVQPNSRGFVFNADAETLIRILNFGSLGALR